MKRMKLFKRAMAFALATTMVFSNLTLSYADEFEAGETVTEETIFEETSEEITEESEEVSEEVLEETQEEPIEEEPIEEEPIEEEPVLEEIDDFSGVKAVYGSPLVDGNIDDVWAKAETYELLMKRNSPDSTASAKVMWDDNALYVLVNVEDATLDKASGNAYEQDSIEVFLDELNDRKGSYESDDLHYRVNFDNERSTDSGDEGRWYSKTSITETGFVIEGCIKWNAIVACNEAKVGFDLQLNCAKGGSRVGEASLFATTSDGYQDTSLFGEAKLVGKTDEDVTPGFPYSLMTYLEIVKSFDLTAYVNGDEAAALIAEVESFLATGSYTQAEIDAYYEKLVNMVNTLDDGSGYTNPRELPANSQLPDIFTFFDGETKVTKENWEARKKEIKEYYDYYMYGPYPDTSDEKVSYEVTDMAEKTVNVKDPITGEKKDITVKQGTLKLTVANSETSGTVSMVFVVPTTPAPEGGYPFYSEMSGYAGDTVYYAASRGMACASWTYTDFASDDLSRGGLFYKIHPYGTDWKHQTGALVAWSWGAGKILDALENGLAAEYNINAENNMLAGVSRLGKATAVAGAYDERIKYVDPTCSGAGGMACFRYSSEGNTYDGANIGKLDSEGNTKITIDQNEPLSSLQASGEIFWFNDNFAKLSSLEQLPFDQYYLASLMASEDRYLMITAGFTGENWTNSASMSLTYLKARELYRMLGLDDHIYINIHETNESGSTPNHKIITKDLAYFIDLMYEKEYGVAREDLTTDRRNIKTCVFFEDVNWDSAWDSLVGNNLTSVASDKFVKRATTLDYGVSLSDIAAALPKTVSVYVDDARYMEAQVDWNVADCGFDPETFAEQSFIVEGTLTLPEGVTNEAGIELKAQALVNVLSKPDDLPFATPSKDGWDKANTYKTVKVLDGNSEAEAAVSLEWDEENLYVKAVVFDKDVFTKEGGSDKEDSISLTIAKGIKAGSKVKNIILTADGEAVAPKYSADFDWNTWATTVNKSFETVNGVDVKAETTEEGYTLEASISWSVLGFEGEDTEVAFEAILNDFDENGAAGHKALFLKEMAHHSETVGEGWFTGTADVGLYAEDLHASKIYPVIKYRTLIADGEIEANWNDALAFTVDNLIDSVSEGKNTADGEAKVKVMWDDTYLYVYADVTDSDVYIDSDADEHKEGIALSIAADENSEAKKYVFGADGTVYNVVWTGDLDFNTFAGKASKSYEDAKGVCSVANITESGWNLEACISFESLGFTPVNGESFMFEAVVNNASSSKKMRDYRKALFATEYPENQVTISGNWYGFFPWSATYNPGFIAKDLTKIGFAGKHVDTFTENIGRYELINTIKNFVAENVDPYPVKTSFDQSVLDEALAYAKNPEATKEGIAQEASRLADMAEAILKDNHYGAMMSKSGTPLVDGKTDDEVWANAYEYKTTVDKEGQYASIKSVWDEKAVYFLVTVMDPTFDVSGSDAHQKDSVEFFVIPTEDSAKNSFGRDGGQWRINRAGVTTVTFGDNEPFYAKLSEIEGGYVVEARYEFAESMKIEALSELSLDIAVNLCANGSRTASVAWASGDCYSNPNKAGKIVFLSDKAGEGSVEAGYNPYVLAKVLDKALLMDVKDYDEKSFNENYDKALLESYYEEALSGTLTEAQISEYYKNVISMMSRITYDGVHKSVLGFEENSEYPDAFTMNDGTVVNSDASWNLRHEEIQDLYEFYMYGKLPKAEETGLEKAFSFEGSDYTITVSRPGIDAASFTFKVDLPSGEAPEGGWPYIINYGGNIDGAQDAGYAVVEFSNYGDVASNDSYYNGVFYKMYPECRGDIYTTGVGPLAARAWGAGLIIDCIEAGVGELSKLNAENSAVTGFSFLGKTALVTGVLEDRIKVTNPAHSGIGGAAPFRYSAQGNFYDTQTYGVEKDHLVTRIEPIGQVQGQGMAWVKTIFADFLGGDCTPFDTYMLLSLVAPRGLFVSAGYYDNGTNPEGMYAAYVQAREVFKFLGVEDRIAFGDYATDHATSTPEWNDLFTFCDHIFFGTELTEEFYSTVFDNSPDRPMYDVIKAPQKVKEGIVAEDGALYYYENGNRCYKGLFELNGDFYYAMGGGKIATGKYYVTRANAIMDKNHYQFDEDGKMILNGIVKIRGEYYYYKDSKVVENAGLVLYNQYYYYISEGGKALTGTVDVVNANGIVAEGSYEFGADGKMILNGIIYINGALRYYLNGAMRSQVGMIEIDGGLYYVSAGAKVYTGLCFVGGKTNGLCEVGKHYFDPQTGKMVY